MMKSSFDPVFCREDPLVHRFQMHIPDDLWNYFVRQSDPIPRVFFTNLASPYEYIVGV